MSIISETLYACKCDNCGKIYNEDEGICYYIEKSIAAEEATDNQWIEHNNKHYCEKCWTWNEDENSADDYTILTKKEASDV